ncbi:MAG TPA: hypothetical protein VHK06_05530 [Candidatus Limnocylindria bacterium]|nr:hypothetical protein [Candidatus Limnocylindria bacterium]
MPTRSRGRDPARAEARRRSRAALRGAEAEPPEVSRASAAASEPRSVGLLARVFPPAPPLPGRRDPLAEFRYAGPLRPVVEGLYLLARNPLAWVAPGVLWALTRVPDPRSILGLVASLVSFAALIGAGWFGWQRPSLFGAAAAILGMLLIVVAVTVLTALQQVPLNALVPPETGAAEIAVAGAVYIALYGLIGLLSGWYGGYLRRRQAQVGAQRQASARRR